MICGSGFVILVITTASISRSLHELLQYQLCDFSTRTAPHVEQVWTIFALAMVRKAVGMSTAAARQLIDVIGSMPTLHLLNIRYCHAHSHKQMFNLLFAMLQVLTVSVKVKYMQNIVALQLLKNMHF